MRRFLAYAGVRKAGMDHIQHQSNSPPFMDPAEDQEGQEVIQDPLLHIQLFILILDPLNLRQNMNPTLPTLHPVSPG